jgi:hypothetical protein
MKKHIYSTADEHGNYELTIESKHFTNNRTAKCDIMSFISELEKLRNHLSVIFEDEE